MKSNSSLPQNNKTLPISLFLLLFLVLLLSFCTAFSDYKLIQKIGEGTFSEVLKAVNVSTGQMVAIKCFKTKYPTEQSVKKLPEIQALKRLSGNEHIAELIDIL